MKVCIVTVYDSINCGSYWQAYSLGHALELLGHSVCYLAFEKSGGASSSRSVQFKKGIETTREYGIPALVKYIHRIIKFENERKKFDIVKYSNELPDDIDCFVLGSDTIWNLYRPHFKNNYKIFWGAAFFPKKVITYAGSVDNTPMEAFQEINGLQEIVNKWSAISVRDKYTKSIIESMTEAHIEIVCDPTLLLDKTYYQQRAKRLVENDYIFLYLFRELSRRQIKELVRFSNKRNLKIISGTEFSKHGYCDKAEPAWPSSFLSYMYFASYVITDTFHGAVFSTNLEKKFVVIDRNKNKVNDFIISAGLENRLVGEERSLFPTLKEDIDYDTTNRAISKMREQSYRYLKTAIEV